MIIKQKGSVVTADLARAASSPGQSTYVGTASGDENHIPRDCATFSVYSDLNGKGIYVANDGGKVVVTYSGAQLLTACMHSI